MKAEEDMAKRASHSRHIPRVLGSMLMTGLRSHLVHLVYLVEAQPSILYGQRLGSM